MSHIRHGPDTERAQVIDVRELVAPAPDTPETLWARLLAYQQALPSVVAEALERLMNEELRLRPEHIRSTVAEALSRLQHDQGPFELHVHPDDRALLDGLPIEVTVRELPSLSRGGCVVTGPGVEVDARRETRLRRVLQRLLLG